MTVSNTHESPIVTVHPVVIKTLKILRVAAFFSAHNAAPMAADVQQHVDLAVCAAADDDGQPADSGRFVTSRLG